jgi:diacylglycerol kinase family enzyme
MGASSAGHLLLASAQAGSAEDEAVAAARAVLATSGPVELVTTATSQGLDDALDRLDGRTLVVAGGDGSLHVAVARLHARNALLDTRLGLVPLGTGNDLARTLDIPLDPEVAAHVVLTADSRPLDLLLDDSGGIVINAVHLGVGAEAAEHAGRLKPRLGLIAYPMGAIAAGLRNTGWRVRVELDGRVLTDSSRRTLMVGIGNGRGIGGGTQLLPHAEPDDGLLDVVVSRACGPFTRVRYGAALRIGDHLRDRDSSSGRGRTVSVSGEPVDVNADGEVGECIQRRQWTVQPASWSLLRP